jgi:hypothetical protein
MSKKFESNLLSEINFTSAIDGHGLYGFVSFIMFDTLFMGCMGVHLRYGRSGIRLVYPQKSGRDVVYPIDQELGEAIEAEVFRYLQGLEGSV